MFGNRQSRAREPAIEEGCATAPGPPGGDQGRLHRQGAAAGASATDPLRTLAHCH